MPLPEGLADPASASVLWLNYWLRGSTSDCYRADTEPTRCPEPTQQWHCTGAPNRWDVVEGTRWLKRLGLGWDGDPRRKWSKWNFLSGRNYLF